MSDFNVDDVTRGRPPFVAHHIGDTDMVTFSITVPQFVAERLEIVAKMLADDMGDAPERAILGAVAAFLEPFERSGLFDDRDGAQ